MAHSTVAAMTSRAVWGGPGLWFAVTVLAVFAVPAWTRPIQDPDLWWLLWSGERLLDGWIPNRNVLNWTAPDVPWTSHEPAVAMLYAAVGIDGMPLLRGLVVTATLLLVLLASWRERCAWAGVLAAGWVVLMIAYGRTERALSVGNLMLAAEMALLVLAPRRPWALPLAAVLVAGWASVHGSFVIGLIALLLWDWRWGAAAALGTLANPYGVHVWDLVIGYGTGSDVRGLVHQTVREWMPPDPTEPLTLLRLVSLAAVLGLLAWARQGRAVLLGLAAAALALQHQRFLDIAAIALAPWMAAVLAEKLPERRERLAPGPFVAAAVALVALPASPGLDAEQYPRDLPVAELALRRVWNDHSLGGFLGYHGVPVFWDSRNDCVPVAVYQDGVAVEREAAGWRGVLARWRVDAVVTAAPGKIEALQGEGWRLAVRRGEVAILLRGDEKP